MSLWVILLLLEVLFGMLILPGMEDDWDFARASVAFANNPSPSTEAHLKETRADMLKRRVIYNGVIGALIILNLPAIIKVRRMIKCEIERKAEGVVKGAVP